MLRTQESVKTDDSIFRRGGKRLCHVVTNLITKVRTSTKHYQARPCFVKDMTKTFWCFFRFIVLTAVHMQNANATFHKVV